MKGMQKIKRGKSFAGVVQYALKPGAHHKSDPAVIGGNMLGGSALELIAEFDGTKQLRPDIQKPVWHNSLRLPSGESLTAEQWSSIADDYMRRMGFSDTHLRCYVLHDDSAGQHIHIIASRIDIAGGKLYLGR
ncbi:TPA: relaxase/mobilization nuclease domain-containing protein, partial [Escherichia coli]|nr:relaxase/mobilization nuclease domain-containing protein [Escherichia coli]